MAYQHTEASYSLHESHHTLQIRYYRNNKKRQQKTCKALERANNVFYYTNIFLAKISIVLIVTNVEDIQLFQYQQFLLHCKHIKMNDFTAPTNKENHTSFVLYTFLLFSKCIIIMHLCIYKSQVIHGM